MGQIKRFDRACEPKRAAAHWPPAMRIDEIRGKLDKGAATPAECAEFAAEATLVSVEKLRAEMGEFGIDVRLDLDQEALRGVLSCLAIQNARMRSIVKDLLANSALQQKEIDELRKSMQTPPTQQRGPWED